MRRWPLIIVLLLVSVVALRMTVFAVPPVEVRVTEVARGDVESTVTNSKAGTVRARTRARLSPGTSGIVVDLRVERGDRVRKGDVLLRLEDDTQSAQLALAERDLDVALAAHERTCLAADRARRELERNERLAADDLVSVDVVDALRNASEVADAECRVAEAEVQHRAATIEVARAELGKTTLRAPFDAVVAEVSVELGEWVTPSVPLLAAPDVIDALDPDDLYVAAPMDEVDAGRLRPGQPVRVTVDSHPGETFAGHVSRLAPYVLDLEQQNRTLEIEVDLDGDAPEPALLPGTSADVEVVLEVHHDALRVPTFALLEGDAVLVLDGERLVRRPVTTGLRNWDWVEIVDGLSGGEAVVSSLDREGVVDGARARRIVDAPTP